MEKGMSSVKDALERLEEVMIRSFGDMVLEVSNFITQSKKTIELVDPKKQLSRGYSIIRNKSGVIRSKKDVKKGDKLELLVVDGIIDSQVI
jgi:exonuclease VII large subunit